MKLEDIKGKVDFGILAIRDDEFSAVLQRFPAYERVTGKRQYNLSRLDLPGGGSYLVAVIRCVEQGSGEAQDAARDFLEDLDPRWLLVVGIAGGVPTGEFGLGDVVVSTRIIDFSIEALLEDRAPEYAVGGGPIHKVAATIVANLGARAEALGDWGSFASITVARPPVEATRASLYGDEAWKDKVRASLEGSRARAEPLVTTGAIASSDRLIKNTKILTAWLEDARQVLAVEMESAGVYRAAHGRQVPLLAIRGLSDIVGLARDPAWTRYACHSAAAFTHALLRTRPIAAPEPPALAGEPASPSLPEAFLTAYRLRMGAVFQRWDRTSAVIVKASESRPRDIRFDEMYHPLGITGDDPTLSGVTRDVAGLLTVLERQRGLVVRGPCGGGKTTWTRWLFRQLLASERAFPLLIALPDLALRWQRAGAQGTERSIDAYLDAWCRDHGLDEWRAHSRDLLAGEGGPLPVLLLDGWDEIGEIGNDLWPRLLGLMNEFPRLRVVITSRHYGAGLPGKKDEFAELHLMPLSNDDAMRFAERTLAAWYPDDQRGTATSVRRFQEFLRGSSEALDLARTPFLLTLMLQVHESGDLPRELHVLYGACVDALLNRRPDRKSLEGAVWPSGHWYPVAQDTRRRIVAELAAKLQDTSKSETGRSVALRTLNEMEALLPATWPETEPEGDARDSARRGFLRWLAGPAALLTETPQGVGFVHVGFQEYLTALHLDTTIEGDPGRVEAFAARAGEAPWRETLLLWAGMLRGKDDKRVQPLLDRLTSSDESAEAKLLAGAMLAHGMGDDSVFERWLASLDDLITNPLSQEMRLCAGAWERSNQPSRRQAIASNLSKSCEKEGIFRRIHFEKFAGACGLLAQIPAPDEATMAWEVTRALRSGQFDTGPGLAAARLLCQLDSEFAGLYRAPDVAWLNLLWPSQRSIVGYLLQLSVAFGATEDDVRHQAAKLLRKPRRMEGILTGDSARQLRASALLGWQRSGAESEGRDETIGLVMSRAMLPIRMFTYYLPRMPVQPVPEKTRGLGTLLRAAVGGARSIARRAGHLVGDGAAQGSRAAVVGMAAAQELIAHVMNLEADTPWLLPFVRAATASQFEAMASWDLLPAEPPDGHWSFLVPAYRMQLGSKSEKVRAAFDESLARYAGSSDPLWPALARHILGESTPDDRVLLIDLAAHPEQRSSTLGSALKYVVRGDISLDGGGEIRLDDLASELNIEPLPYLEEAVLPEEVTPEDLRKAELHRWLNELGRKHGPRSRNDQG